MKLQELNNQVKKTELILLEKSFTDIKKELVDYFKKVEQNLESVNITYLKLIIKKVDDILANFDKVIKDSSLMELYDWKDKYKKQLSFLKEKLDDFFKVITKIDVAPKLMNEIEKSIKDTIERITSSIKEVEEKIQHASHSAAEEAGMEVKKKVKVPVGLATDLKTKKNFIAKKRS